MTASNPLPPPVMWAQRKAGVFLTVCLEDCKDPKIELSPAKVHFKGTGGTDNKEYELNLELFEDIDPDKSTHVNKGRVIEFELKKSKDSFWPRLTKTSEKKHWLKVDFARWKDEDDSEDEASAEGGPPGGGGGTDFEEMMRQMGGLSGQGLGGGMGMGGLGGGLGGMGMGMDGKPNLDDLEKETDSDDEDDELPDLE
jgi:prostaglandin-E synthase